MKNLAKCPYCKTVLIGKAIKNHSCMPSLDKIVDITYAWWVNSDLPKIGEVLIIKGKDGTLYRAKPWLSDGVIQGNPPDTNDTEP